MRRFLTLLSLIVLLAAQPTAAQKKPAKRTAFHPAITEVKERNVRAHLEFLASDALQGRGSGTRDELIAGTYIASQLRQAGIEPAGDNGGFLQIVSIKKEVYTEAPALTAAGNVFIHGKDMNILRTSTANSGGPLQRLKPGIPVQKGAFVYVELTESKDSPPVRAQINGPLSQGATAVIVADSAQIRQRFSAAGRSMPELGTQIGGVPASSAPGTILLLNEAATKSFAAVPEGADLHLKGQTKMETSQTWNVIGRLAGGEGKGQSLLITAHMDHLGMRDNNIYNGADDDASGVVAVLEMARALGGAPKMKRDVYFVLFGSEEVGGFGAQYFLAHPPVPLAKMVANLEFEMIGRPDTKVAANTLWLTGYERSDLGAELAKRGAKLVADPHPDQQFFMRSDNYALAKKGVIAHTVSSFGLHSDYHQPGDDVEKVDLKHMTWAIQSMIEPVQWLANATFVPKWKEGMKP